MLVNIHFQKNNLYFEQFGFFVEVLDQDVERDMNFAPSASVEAVVPTL